MSETNEHDSPSIWWKDVAKRRFVAHCEAALVGGAWHREYLIKLGMPAASIFDGYDAVDNEHFQRGAERARQDADHTRRLHDLPTDYFLACSRFEPKKNLHRLIEGYGAYSRRVGDNPWKLVIAGDGPSRADLDAVARDLNLKQDVLVRGIAGYEELPGIYGLANAFVHASTTEQWGLVVNEAMDAGLPLLVSERCGCVSELVKDGVNGFTFNPWKTDEIAEKMLMMHQDSLQRQKMGHESAAIINDWGPERFARSLGRAVEFALGSPPRRRPLASKTFVRLMAVR